MERLQECQVFRVSEMVTAAEKAGVVMITDLVNQIIVGVSPAGDMKTIMRIVEKLVRQQVDNNAMQFSFSPEYATKNIFLLFFLRQ